MNSVTTIENAAPWANEIASCVYFEISPAPRLSVHRSPASRSDPLQAVGVEPALEPVDVLLGPRPPPVVRHGEVAVDPIGGRAGLVDDDAAEHEHDHRDRGGEEEDDERHREPARKPQALQVAHERVEQERDHGGDEEEEDRVAEDSREHPDDQEPDGQADELDPAGNPDDRAGRLAHGPIVAAGIGFQRRPRPLRSGETSATVAPMATPRTRRAARHRARRQRAQHRARRLAVIGIVAALALVTLILTAFGSNSPEPVATTTAATPVASGVPPEPEPLATVGNLQIKLPIAGEAVTAIGFHGEDGGAMELQPCRPPGERGPARPALAPDRGLRPRKGRSGTSSRAGRAPRCSTSARRRGPTSTRRSTAPSSRSRTS